MQRLLCRSCLSLVWGAGILLCACTAAQESVVAQSPLFANTYNAPVDPLGQFEFNNGELVSYIMLPEARQLVEEEREAGNLGGSIVRSLRAEAEPTGAPPLDQTESVTSRRIEQTSANDAATALQDSPSIQSLNIQRRSAIAFDPRVRGYHIGQVFTQGEDIFWNPVRPDLDSMLGRIDPRLIDQITVIPGPYSARYGPGFSFIDANLGDTPRYECYESYNRLGYTIRANGPQHYLVDTYWGGNANYGYMINYTYRQGASYYAGNGQRIPSTYLVNNVSTQFGFNLSQDAKVETRSDFLNQGRTQIPGQFWDVDKLQTNAFLISLTDDASGNHWSRMRVNAWHHQTPSNGTVRNEPVFNVRDRVETAIEANLDAQPGSVFLAGTTNSKLISSGGRLEFVFGEVDSAQLFAGADVRHLRQAINENFNVTGAAQFRFNTELPEADMVNPGIYTELLLPMNLGWNTRIGARGDYVRSTAQQVDPNATSFLPPGPLRNSNGLYAFYLANDYQIGDCTTATLNFGQAQRPPTLIERYSDGVFVSVLQSGFSRVVGNPFLNPERLWQIDAGLSGDYGDTRGGVNFYQSWVLDYITYRGATVIDPTGAQLIRYFATPQATLTGFEFKGERDLSSEWTAIAASHYLQGQDQTLGAPLWGISPLEGLVGLRWNQVIDNESRGVELLVRMVTQQSRLGVMRVGDQTTLTTTRIEQVTPSFTTVAMRGFWNFGDNLRFVGGVENLFNATYLQHLDLRLPRGGGGPVAPPAPSGTTFPVYNPAFAYAPGITPYLGIDWTF